MKTQEQSKVRNLWHLIVGCLRLAAKLARSKYALKGKSFEPFPKEAPH